MKPEGAQRPEPGLAVVLFGVLAGWVVLQVFRTRFFLTDDTFSLFYPVFVSVGRAVMEGRPFWICQELFDGNYALSADAQMIPLWHPLNFSFSLLGTGACGTWLVDVLALLNLLAAGWGFHRLMAVVASEGGAGLGPWFRVFLAWSYVFSMYSLLLGSSGIWYLANVAALPWMVAGVLDRRLSAQVGLAVAVFHGAVGGYPSCFAYSVLFLGFPFLWQVRCRGWRDALRPLGAVGAGAVAALPFLVPTLAALPDSLRAGAISVEVASEGRYPLAVTAVSLVASTVAAEFGEVELFGVKAHAYALASSAMGLFVLMALVRPARRWSAWDGLLLAALAASALLVARPDWLGRCIQGLPVLGSLRWPHKEMVLVVFWAHLFALRGNAFTGRFQGAALVASVLLYLVPFVLAGPPSFGAHEVSRRLLFSGEAGRHWDSLKEGLQGRRLVPVLPRAVVEDPAQYPSIPWILLGSHNFPALWPVDSWSGYSATMPRKLFERTPPMANVYGVYALEEVGETLRDPARVGFLYDAQTGSVWTLDGSVRHQRIWPRQPTR